ncbi:hypothetical protein HPP92_022881 [Vanilla planifolia]|uniref:Uncharacterized protein n=1 Tax=Vanilla planifolia TaxID=51239 RepID=A0A835PU73_VANPL|nr:hypothetical protein HPP92_022881 [Vanilla planifolia]
MSLAIDNVSSDGWEVAGGAMVDGKVVAVWQPRAEDVGNERSRHNVVRQCETNTV